MLYELPAGPQFRLVGPDDEDVPAAPGVDLAGRYAVVIGDPSEAVVIVGDVTDLTAYLDPLTGPIVEWLTRAVAELHQRSARPGHGHDATEPATDDLAAALPSAGLVTLPHTGIQVPDPTVRVSALQQQPGRDGVAYTAIVRHGRRQIGTIHNDGNGGASTYLPATRSRFTVRHMAAFAAASRDRHGQPIPEEDLFEQLIQEFEHAHRVAAAVRDGRSLLRLRAPLIIGGDLPVDHYTARFVTAPQVTGPAARAALAAAVRRVPVEAGQWWQVWTGDRWDDLTPADPQAPRSEPGRKPRQDPDPQPDEGQPGQRSQ